MLKLQRTLHCKLTLLRITLCVHDFSYHSMRSYHSPYYWYLSLYKNYCLVTGHSPEGGGTPHIKGVGMLIRNFELNPLKETDLGMAQAFFDP